MLARTGLGATLALSASLTSAILLPPGLALESTTSEQAGILNAESSHRLMSVACRNCPYAESDSGSMAWTEGVGNSLLFDLDTGVEHDRLSINGATLFPPRFGLIPQPIYVHQIPSAVAPEDFIREHPDHKSLRLTGYEFRFDAAQTISDAGNELLPMQLTIHSIAGQAIPTKILNIFMIKDIEGRLSIANVGLEEVPSVDEEVDQPAQECNDWPVVCKIKAVLAAKMHGMKTSFRKGGCRKGMGHGPAGGKLPSHITSHPPHGEDGHPHHRHHGHHSQGHHHLPKFFRILQRLLLPVVAGIVVGVVAYFAGMLLGMTVWFVYIKLCGRNGQYIRVADDEENSNNSDGGEEYLVEKAVYYDDGKIVEDESEAPPMYEEAVEKEVVVVVERA